jgi:hypothetical protein
VQAPQGNYTNLLYKDNAHGDQPTSSNFTVSHKENKNKMGCANSKQDESEALYPAKPSALPSKPSLKHERQISQQISIQNLQDKVAEDRKVKLLLYGPAHAGKTTFLNQLRVSHGKGFSLDERRQHAHVLIENLVEGMLCYVALRFLGSKSVLSSSLSMARYWRATQSHINCTCVLVRKLSFAQLEDKQQLSWSQLVSLTSTSRNRLILSLLHESLVLFPHALKWMPLSLNTIPLCIITLPWFIFALLQLTTRQIYTSIYSYPCSRHFDGDRSWQAWRAI